MKEFQKQHKEINALKLSFYRKMDQMAESSKGEAVTYKHAGQIKTSVIVDMVGDTDFNVTFYMDNNDVVDISDIICD